MRRLYTRLHVGTEPNVSLLAQALQARPEKAADPENTEQTTNFYSSNPLKSPDELQNKASTICDPAARACPASILGLGDRFNPDDIQYILVGGGQDGSRSDKVAHLSTLLEEYKNQHPYASNKLEVYRACDDTLREYRTRSEEYTVRAVDNFFRSHNKDAIEDGEITGLLEDLYNERLLAEHVARNKGVLVPVLIDKNYGEKTGLSFPQSEIVYNQKIPMGSVLLDRYRGGWKRVALLGNEEINRSAAEAQRKREEREAQVENERQMDRESEAYADDMVNLVLDSLSEGKSYQFKDVFGSEKVITRVDDKGDKFQINGGTPVAKWVAVHQLSSVFERGYLEVKRNGGSEQDLAELHRQDLAGLKTQATNENNEAKSDLLNNGLQTEPSIPAEAKNEETKPSGIENFLNAAVKVIKVIDGIKSVERWLDGLDSGK
jgi:hypothetical protein